MRWSEACSASEPCSCVQLVGETFLWISVLPNRLGQEGASEGSQRGSPVLPLIKHISVVSQKARWNPFNEMRVHIYHNKEKTAHCLGFDFSRFSYNMTEPYLRHLCFARVDGLVCRLQWTQEIPNPPNSCHLPPAQWNEAWENIIFYSPGHSWWIKQTLSKSLQVVRLDDVYNSISDDVLSQGVARYLRLYLKCHGNATTDNCNK